MVWALTIREPVGDLHVGHWQTLTRLEGKVYSSYIPQFKLQHGLYNYFWSYIHIFDPQTSCHDVVRSVLWEQLHTKVVIDLTWISFLRPVLTACILYHNNTIYIRETLYILAAFLLLLYVLAHSCCREPQLRNSPAVQPSSRNQLWLTALGSEWWCILSSADNPVQHNSNMLLASQ